jgi:VIT1/CCC1 family predicted Fe2+/Mn2+ transporter
MSLAEPRRHREKHLLERVGWLRAAVLGANDGIVSTSSLILGVAAAKGYESSVLLAGVAGVVAGAMSMAAGEYVSVHSQRDLERAALDEERAELHADAEGEHRELATIYVRRGLDRELAERVATQLTAHDALGAHARDELGITRQMSAKPLQAAIASAMSFAVGGVLPLVVAYFARVHPIPWVAGAALISLAILGGVAAKAGNAPVGPSVARVVFWSVLAMAATAGAGMLFGTA